MRIARKGAAPFRGRARKGLTLVETVIVIVVSFIGLAGIATLGEIFTRSWRESRTLASLQEDIDLASYAIKGIMEEAATWTPAEGSSAWAEASSETWTYRVESDGDRLLLAGPAGTEEVVTGLESLVFAWGENETASWARVNLSLARGNRSLGNEFLVVRRNRPSE